MDEIFHSDTSLGERKGLKKNFHDSHGRLGYFALVFERAINSREWERQFFIANLGVVRHELCPNEQTCHETPKPDCSIDYANALNKPISKIWYLKRRGDEAFDSNEFFTVAGKTLCLPVVLDIFLNMSSDCCAGLHTCTREESVFPIANKAFVARFS